MPAAPKTRYIVVLPTFGAPYLLATINKDKTTEYCDALLKGVDGTGGGDSWVLDRKMMAIHPMFVESNARWAVAERLRNYPQTKVWVNDDGVRRGLAPNMATILHPSQRTGGCPHLLGDVVLDVPHKGFVKMGINPDCLKLAPCCLGKDGKFEGYEPEDDGEMEAKAAEFAGKGWDYKESTGAVYIARV